MTKANETIGSDGHRERLRKRFEATGFQGFHDYEVLELLLTTIIPRKDVKPAAKKLIAKFKNMQGLLSADPKQIEQVEGIGKKTVFFLSLLNEFIAYYFEQRAFNQEIQFSNIAEAVNYFRAHIGSKPVEVLRAIYLDNKNRIINSENMSEGTVTEVTAYPRKIVESALKCGASSVLIGHNHPGGVPRPSRSDDLLTGKINNALKTVNILLQDHLIITEQSYFSYRSEGFL